MYYIVFDLTNSLGYHTESSLTCKSSPLARDHRHRRNNLQPARRLSLVSRQLLRSLGHLQERAAQVLAQRLNQDTRQELLPNLQDVNDHPLTLMITQHLRVITLLQLLHPMSLRRSLTCLLSNPSEILILSLTLVPIHLHPCDVLKLKLGFCTRIAQLIHPRHMSRFPPLLLELVSQFGSLRFQPQH